MKIKKGDQVKILSGKDRGKKGKILQILPSLDKVVVEGANLLTKHARAKRQGQKGERVKFSAPLHISNVMLICPKCNKPTRLGFKKVENKKVRICKKCKISF